MIIIFFLLLNIELFIDVEPKNTVDTFMCVKLKSEDLTSNMIANPK